MENVTIRELRADDVASLQRLGKQTFLETFSEGNTEENMNKYLDEQLSLQKLSAEIADPGSRFYFAELDGNVIGYLKVNFGNSQTELKDESSVEVERIYVLKQFHGKKAGQLLYDKAIEIARERKADYVWLGVWEENARAIAFYKKNGFVEFDKHIFRLGNDDQTDIMMKLQLNG